MLPVPSFPESQIDTLARFLGECGTGQDITRVLADQRIVDESGESTKWRRLYWVFQEMQRTNGSANGILAFIQSYLAPARFVDRQDDFEECRAGLNGRLAFSGLEFGEDGDFRRRRAARTLNEAETRSRTIEAKFRGRRMHPEVLKYCRAELMQDNYFHAVFEATKGLAQRIRSMSGVDGDGAELVDKVFSVKRPVLALNTLRTETERSEHKGFAALLKGCFGVRNPLAHEPKILWEGKDDAALRPVPRVAPASEARRLRPDTVGRHDALTAGLAALDGLAGPTSGSRPTPARRRAGRCRSARSGAVD